MRTEKSGILLELGISSPYEVFWRVNYKEQALEGEGDMGGIPVTRILRPAQILNTRAPKPHAAHRCHADRSIRNGRT